MDVEIIVRVAAEHKDSKMFESLGGKIILTAANYDEAWKVSNTLLNLSDDKYEYGDLLLYNNGVLIEINE